MEKDVNTNLRQAEKSPNFWEKWGGTPEGALASLTEDIYSYEAENSAYGKGIAIKYGDKNFWYSPSEKALFNSANDKITSQELRENGDDVIAEQINRLIGLSLVKTEK